MNLSKVTLSHTETLTHTMSKPKIDLTNPDPISDIYPTSIS